MGTDMRDTGREQPDTPTELNGDSAGLSGDVVRDIETVDTVILTVGNELMGDDGAGCVMGRLFRHCPGTAVVEGGTAPENVLGIVAGMRPKLIVVTDAIDHGGAPGDMVILRPDEVRGEAVSTHGTTSLMMLFLARATGAEILMVGIQPGRLTHGGLSAPLREAVGRLAVFAASGGIRDVIRRIACTRVRST